MLAQNKRLIYITSSVILILLIPLIAMHFTNEVNWTLMDFIVAGILLFGAGLTIELVLRKVKSTQYRIIICLIILLGLLLLWAELAVGLFGSPIAGS